MLAKRVEPALAGPDHVVENGDAEEPPGLGETARDVAILGTRRRVARGMVVEKKHRDGPEEHATVHCTREGPAWRVEPELPDVLAPQRRADAGM